MPTVFSLLFHVPSPYLSPLSSTSILSLLPHSPSTTTMVNQLLRPFLSLFILLFHLGCFIISSRHHQHRRNSAHSFKNKLTSTPKHKFFSFIKCLSFSSSKPTTEPVPSLSSPSSSTRSVRINAPLINPLNPTHEIKPPLASRNDIYPCSACGEIFQTLSLLEQHQSTKHAVSELFDGENIVRIIFKTGWPEKAKRPLIHRILKIHSNSKITSRFEEYREYVKSRAAASSRALRDERCIADGNELLRFHCTTFICDLDSSICTQNYCSLCGIIRSGFSPKMDGISTFPTGYRAHVSLPEDVEEEFKFMNVKRAMIVCRVVAGRVGCDPALSVKDDPGFDSLAGRGGGDEEEDELLVFSPWAVLPCFVIVYTVQ